MINNIEDLNIIKDLEALSFIYFKNDKCSVCVSLMPQIQRLVNSWNENFYVVDCFDNPEIAAQNLIMTVPALKVFYAGQELISMIRFVDLAKLQSEYNRIKKLLD
ncbi:MAG: thioredoxin family protein [Bacteroidales bacterium]|nr:thioredoxin family protein [Bacteroidales bacterium]